jgi:hypothetical protein
MTLKRVNKLKVLQLQKRQRALEWKLEKLEREAKKLFLEYLALKGKPGKEGRN